MGVVHERFVTNPVLNAVKQTVEPIKNANGETASNVIDAAPNIKYFIFTSFDKSLNCFYYIK